MSSNVPASLPETFDELARLMRICIRLGYGIAAENVIANENRTGFAFIDWTVADQRLAEVLARTR